jgi:hypothetical protein
MAFIDKKDPVVLNIKLTSKGRELLSKGILNFSYYTVGDSEIDYNFNTSVIADNSSYSPSFSNILRPTDKNPNLLSFITRNLSGDPYNVISNVPSTPTIIQNTAQPLGFFSVNTSSTTFIIDTDHVKQPDVMIKIDLVTGGTRLNLFQSSTYLANVNEPQVGDLILIKWTNPFGIDTTGYTVNTNYPTPYLIYKIQNIVSGSLAANNLIINVDRNLPKFDTLIGGTSGHVAGALIYYNYINFSGTSIFNDFSTDYVDQSVIAFLQNCQCPTILFPFWNMSIIYTEDIVGVKSTDRSFTQYNTKTYGGFVSYIQNQAPINKKLGVIHYTNSSPSNTYAEELYQNTPVLNLPTIMWHKSPNKKLGTTFKAIGNVKLLTGTTMSLNTSYYDLADNAGNVVGKVFNNLKIFVIEDQELLFAMSYKSNRSWTLPNYSVGINDNIVIGCASCLLNYQISANTPSVINGSDGSLFIHNIQSNFGVMVLEVLSGSSRITYQPITGNTLISNLNAGNYTVNVYDLGSPNCVVSSGITLQNPSSLLAFRNLSTTANGLNPNFNIIQNSPTNITINQTDIGVIFGTASVLVKPYGVTPIISDTWSQFVSGKVNISTLVFKAPYTIYVRDSGATFNYMISKNYVAAGSPLNPSFTLAQGSDAGGNYILVSNYTTTIVPNVNPIVGAIQISVYPTTSVALNWTNTLVFNKIYINKSGNYNVAIREAFQEVNDYITMFTVIQVITI